MERKRHMWQVAVAMVTILAWVTFISLFALLWAPSLSLFQNIVIFLASFVAAVTVGAGTYAMRYGWEPSRTRRADRISAAVEEAIKEKIKEKLEEEASRANGDK